VDADGAVGGYLCNRSCEDINTDLVAPTAPAAHTAGQCHPMSSICDLGANRKRLCNFILVITYLLPFERY